MPRGLKARRPLGNNFLEQIPAKRKEQARSLACGFGLSGDPLSKRVGL
jgi:hypothetical protein